MGLDITFYRRRRNDGEKHEYKFETVLYKDGKWSDFHKASIMAEDSDEASETYMEQVSAMDGYDSVHTDTYQTEDSFGYTDSIGYFRKVNFLMGIFDPYQSNEEIVVENFKSKLTELKGNIESIFSELGMDADKQPDKDTDIDTEKLQEIAEPLLPTQGGFFFGSTEYDIWYIIDLYLVRKWINEVVPDIDEDKYEYIFEGDY